MPAVPNLRAIREKGLLTQDELAEKAGVHTITISRLETGKRQAEFKTLKKLARALGVEPHELVGAPDVEPELAPSPGPDPVRDARS